MTTTTKKPTTTTKKATTPKTTTPKTTTPKTTTPKTTETTETTETKDNTEMIELKEKLEKYQTAIPDYLLNKIIECKIDEAALLKMILEHTTNMEKQKNKTLTSSEIDFKNIIDFIIKYNDNQGENSHRFFIATSIIVELRSMSGQTVKNLVEKYSETINSHHEKYQLTPSHNIVRKPVNKRQLKLMYQDYIKNNDDTILMKPLTEYSV